MLGSGMWVENNVVFVLLTYYRNEYTVEALTIVLRVVFVSIERKKITMSVFSYGVVTASCW